MLKIEYIVIYTIPATDCYWNSVFFLGNFVSLPLFWYSAIISIAAAVLE